FLECGVSTPLWRRRSCRARRWLAGQLPLRSERAALNISLFIEVNAMSNDPENAAAATESIREQVRAKYAEAARRVATGSASCCGMPSANVAEASAAAPVASCCGPITANLYDPAQTSALPEKAVTASLGCGNPTALAQLSPGEVVLDLGSGGGVDVLLSARRVAPNGKAYGLDMTDEMLALARENQRKSGIANAEFLKGEIEGIPLPENSVDVIISNCVINLSADKSRVLREAFRVLRPGGRFAVSDVVVRDVVRDFARDNAPRGARHEVRDDARHEIPAEIRRSMELWIGCVAGALHESEYRAKLAAAGFTDIEIEPTRIYSVNDARQFLASAGIDADAIAPHVEGRFASAFIRARKPNI
ncbi:MAG TPA: arsenite methyltransferase, partial [Candidatus Acidoferrales bacterium]|nr:arsenite methyltransferase [Candidatus Acidoferrales bacterium]